MCGALINNSNDSTFSAQQSNIPNNGFSSPGSGFSSGNNFKNPNENLKNKRENYSPDYKNQYANMPNNKVPKGDRDIFDFYQEHKKKIKVVLITLLILIGAFAIHKYIEYKSTPKQDAPLLLNLYYDIDPSFSNTSSGNNKVVYTKSGNKGSACSISISYGTSTSGNHVKDFYDSAKKALDPEKDKNGNVIDSKEIFITRESESTINDTKWYFMSVFYRTDVSTQQFNILRYRYYTALYKGYFYDIELVNNSNEVACNSTLDNFVKSLRFIDTDKK